MALELWEPRELMSLRQDARLAPVPNFILNEYFGSEYYSEDGNIKMGKLGTPFRKLAPFVRPSDPGRPIFERKGESVDTLTPAYIKLKDSIRPEDARNVLPSEVWRNGGQRPTIEQRFEARVAEVMAFHLRAIEMQKAWMAARAFFDGKITINYAHEQGQPSPVVEVDFGRATNHTVVKTTDYWNNPDTLIMSDLEEWINRMYLTEFGGTAERLIVGASVGRVFRANKQIKDLLDKNFVGAEGTGINIQRGLVRTYEPLVYLGTLDKNLEVWQYRDTVQNAAGQTVELFDPRDVCLVGKGGVEGVVAYGAIYDAEAMMAGQSLTTDVYSKMWVEKEGPVNLLNQSSPLVIPQLPNRTLKARVLQ